jgi:glycosyltransferase involved in cell wall biosynthesis
MYQVIAALQDSSLGGVTSFSVNLVRGLCAHGIPAHIVLTESDTDRVNLSEVQIPLDSDVRVERLPVSRDASWSEHWLAMIRYLESHAPCIYIPNHDYRHACVSPKLSRRVMIVGIAHTDDPLNYDQVARLGRYWNAIVSTSPTIAEQIAAMDRSLIRRLVTIPIGVSVPAALPARQSIPNAPLRLIYHGRLRQEQKRILDLPLILAALQARDIPVELTIAGTGVDEEALRTACQPFVFQQVVRFLGYMPPAQIAELLAEHDLFLLTSEFEGLPNALLEAMAHGCVPIVTDIRSGIPLIVNDGVNGYRVPIGDIGAFADRIAGLYHQPELWQSMRQAAYRAVIEGGFRIEDMVDQYIALFEQLQHEAKNGVYHRPIATLEPPPVQVDGISILPGDYRNDISLTERALFWSGRKSPAALVCWLKAELLRRSKA